MSVVTRPDRATIDLRSSTGESEPLGSPKPNWLIREIHRPAAYLFPIRVFVGVGWLRSFAEKFGDPAWRDGSAVREFLDIQRARDLVAMPAYDSLLGFMIDNAGGLVGWLVMFLQLLVGLAILFGALTNLALIVGVVMNVNFMLAGEINPSAFYIVIQTLLFVTGSGAVLGVDRLLARIPPPPSILTVARPDLRHSITSDRLGVGVLLSLSGVVSWLGFAHVTDFSPTGITDPALVMGTVMAVTTVSLLILWVRLVYSGPKAVAGPKARYAPATERLVKRRRQTPRTGWFLD